MNTTFHSRASRDVRHRRRSVARRDVVSPGARLVRVEHEHVGRVEGGSIKPITTRPLVWNFSTYQLPTTRTMGTDPWPSGGESMFRADQHEIDAITRWSGDYL